MHVRKKDLVKVISGDERGKQGVILRVDTEKERALVQGVNLVWKHLRRSAEHPHGARIQKEAMLAVSNLKVVCVNCNKPTTARHETRKSESGESYRVRLCRKCGQAVTAEA